MGFLDKFWSQRGLPRGEIEGATEGYEMMPSRDGVVHRRNPQGLRELEALEREAKRQRFEELRTVETFNQDGTVTRNEGGRYTKGKEK